MENLLASLSAILTEQVQTASRLVAAVRVGPNRHISGLVGSDNTLLVADQVLPAADTYTVVLPGRAMASGGAVLRDTATGLACLRLDAGVPVSWPPSGAAAVGALAVIIGANADATPTCRIAVIHRVVQMHDTPAAILDLPAERLDQGSIVLDTTGHLLGLLTLGSADEAFVVPASVVPTGGVPAGLIGRPGRSAPHEQPAARRGWLGLSLQPITVPDELAAKAGQTSGRMVMSVTKGGPADQGGLRIGDVLLAINGSSLSGENGMRTLLGPERIGATLQVRLLRDGIIMRSSLIVAAQPARD